MTGSFFYHKNITTKINESRSRHTHTRAHRFPSSSLSKDFGTAERCGVSHFYIEPAPINRLPCLARRAHWLTSAHSVLNSQKPQHVLGGRLVRIINITTQVCASSARQRSAPVAIVLCVCVSKSRVSPRHSAPPPPVSTPDPAARYARHNRALVDTEGASEPRRAVSSQFKVHISCIFRERSSFACVCLCPIGHK